MTRNYKNKKVKLIIGLLISFIIILILTLSFKLVSSRINNKNKSERPVKASEFDETKLRPKSKENLKADLSKLIGYKKTLDSINLRKSPTIDGDILTSVPKGAYVEYFGSLEEWDKVEYNGVEGYCASEYLELNEEENIFKVIDGILIVNKNYGLPEDFNPGLNKRLEDAFIRMKTEAAKEGMILKIASGFRDYKFQEEIFNGCVEMDGLEKALTYTAKPGYSEHQTGLSIDIMGSDKEARINSKFDNTKEALWLKENAHKYGFILRYPKDKEDITQVKFESWHYRYLGETEAKAIYKSGESLEEYLNLK